MLFDLLTIVCLYGCADLCAILLQSRVQHVPYAVLQLVGLGICSLVAVLFCSIGFSPIAVPPYLEELSAQPFLSCIFLGLGSGGFIFRLLRKNFVCDRWQALVYTSLAFASAWLLLPPFCTDDSLYHLTIILHYLTHGGFNVIAGHGNASFPAFGEMIAFWPLAAGSLTGARAVQLMAVAFGFRASCDLLPELTTKQLAFGWCLFIFTPVVFAILPSSHIDVLQAVYEITAVLLLVHYQSQRHSSILLSAAFIGGCAAACKFTALSSLPFFALVLLLMWRNWREQQIALPKASVIIASLFLALIPVLPWLIRNCLVWHNPVYPFATSLFPGSEHALLPEQIATLDAFMDRFGPQDPGDIQVTGILALLRLPLDLLFSAQFNRMSFDGVMGPLVLVTCVAWLLNRNNKKIGIAPLIGWFSLYHVLIWLSTSWQMRFLIAAYWSICFATPIFIDRIRLPIVRVTLYSAAIISVVMTWPALAAHMPALDRRMLGDPSSRHALRLEREPASALCDAANQIAIDDANAYVMLVWTQKLSLWCAANIMSESYYESASFHRWLLSENPMQQFKAHGITHVLIDEHLFLQLPKAGLSNEEAEELNRVFAAFKQVQEHWQVIAVSNQTRLYQLPN